jgi:hypothetical protein
MDALATPRGLGQPVVDDGIRWLNFFNGRVLSAEDLRTDHDAIAEARRQLGRAIGDGIVGGFEVTEDVLASTSGAPILTVRPGLALNGDGQALELRRQIRIGLIRVDAPTGGTGADFANCDVVLPGTAGLGVYVLTVGPAASDLGKAEVAGLGNQPAACNTAYSVEGVRFRLFQVPLEDGDLDEPDLLQNRIAYRMFGEGTQGAGASVVDPFGSGPSAATLLDDLAASCFRSSDVPLAVLFWKPLGGIRFIDRWAVARRPTQPSGSLRFGDSVAERTLAAGEARFLEFQDHIERLRVGPPASTSLVATARFVHLPPLGILPLTLGDARGFDVLRFFQGLTVRHEVHIEGAVVRSLIRESFAYPPISLESQEAIRLYLVRENVQGSGRRYVMFASGHLPYRADAKFDLAYWNVANFAQRY